jgi:hypothetical protein
MPDPGSIIIPGIPLQSSSSRFVKYSIPAASWILWSHVKSLSEEYVILSTPSISLLIKMPSPSSSQPFTISRKAASGKFISSIIIPLLTTKLAISSTFILPVPKFSDGSFGWTGSEGSTISFPLSLSKESGSKGSTITTFSSSSDPSAFSVGSTVRLPSKLLAHTAVFPSNDNDITRNIATIFFFICQLLLFLYFYNPCTFYQTLFQNISYALTPLYLLMLITIHIS